MIYGYREGKVNNTVGFYGGVKRSRGENSGLYVIYTSTIGITLVIAL